MREDVKPIVGRTARIAFAIVVAGVSLYQALHVWNDQYIQPFVWFGQRSNDERYLDTYRIAPSAQISRRVTLHVTANRLTADQQLEIKGDANLCRAVHQSALRQHATNARRVTGALRIDSFLAEFEPPVVTSPEGAGDCTVQTSIREQTLFRQEDTVPSPSDRVSFEMDTLRATDLVVAFDAKDVRIAGLTRPPSRLSSGVLVFHWKDAVPQSVAFQLTRTAVAQPRIGDIVTRLDQNWLPFLGPPLTLVLAVLPYALFVFVGRRFAASPRAPLIQMAEWMLTLYLLLHLTDVIVSVNDWIFHDLLRDYKLEPFVGGDTFGAIFAAFACIAWPLLIVRWCWKERPSRIVMPSVRVPWLAIAAAAAFAASSGAALYAAWARNDWPHPRNEWIIALGFVALAAGCFLLMREVGGGVVHALGLLLGGASLFFLSGPYASWGTLPLATVFLLGLILALRAGFAYTRPLSVFESVLFIAGAVLATYLFMPTSFFTPYWEILALGEAANDAVLLALAAAFLILLHDHSAHHASSTHAVDLGFAFALAIFFNHRSGVYGAAVVGSGYLLLRYLLFPEKRRVPLLPDDAAQIRNGITKLISKREAERAIDKRRKAVLAKVEDGSEAWAKYEICTSELEAAVREYEKDTEAIATSQRALAHGPIEPPWQRGRLMAMRAAALAIPWCVAYAAFYSRDAVPSSPQWWLDVIATFVLGLAQWPLFGFFFGYFYPDIRGGTGLTKALVYVVTIAVPPVLAHVIFNAELPRLIFALWIFQNFIQSMVLGLLAGDYRTLRTYGLGWRHLRDVHNLGVLTAYGTSVAIAIGGAISTAIAGGVVDALKALAK